VKTPLVVLVLLLCSIAPAQPQQNQQQYPSELDLGKPAPSQTTIAVADVIKLSQAKISDDIIVQQLSKKGQHFDLSTEQLIQLKNAGVSDRVIRTMIDPTKGNVPSPTQNTQIAPPQQPKQLTDAAPAASSAEIPSGAHAFVATPAMAQPMVSSGQTGNKPRVYFESASKGSEWNAARNQSMEMSKDFEKDCSVIKVTINQAAADYTIVLNHIEHGFVRDNQIQVANKDGDLISKTKEGGSIRGDMKKACQVILADWDSKVR
jgi:hypothetical protein